MPKQPPKRKLKKLRPRELPLTKLDRLRDRLTSKPLVFQTKRDLNAKDLTDPHLGILNGDNQEREEEVEEAATDKELLDKQKEHGVVLGTRDGSRPGTKATGDGTSMNGNNTTKNAKLKVCAREDALLNTKYKK